MTDDYSSADTGAILESERLLGIDTPLGPDRVILTRLEGEDRLSQCFRYRCTIETEEPEAAIEGLLSMPVTLWLLNHRADLRRPIAGHVRRVVGSGRSDRGAQLYQLEVVPRLWFLSCTVDCRIFQNLNVPDIIASIFADEGLTDYVFRIQRTDYPPLEYCVQFRESSLDFVSRLMEHLGLFYWHEHSAGEHLLVIADGNAATGRCEPSNLTITPPDGHGELHSLEIDCAFRPGKWTLNDYDFQSPTKMLKVDAPTVLTVPRMADHEVYEFPGKFFDVDSGRRLGRLRIEMEEAQHRRVIGTGRCVGFDPGRRFSVGTGSAAPSYLLTEVRHRATSPGLGTGDDAASYDNEFVAIRAELAYRPERRTPRPYVQGPQTATVVGPAGESIYCDPLGRVRVQFHWDRRGQRNEQSSCWMRVTQSRSGSYYGTLTIPHVGHEVIVSFLDGDPDRPLITGTAPNAMTMPPVGLPLDKNKTVQRDHGDNKIVMQGKAGSEYVTMAWPRAVNLFASGRNARSLSSATTFYPVGGTYTFYSNPNENNAGTVTNNGSVTSGYVAGTDQTGSGTSVQIPSFKDDKGLKELWLEWYGTEKSDIAVSGSLLNPDGSASSTAGTYGTQDGTTGGSYLNWGSEGKINCLTLDNNNNWCYGDLNTWVNGTVNSQIQSGSIVTIFGYSITNVVGDNTSNVAGGNTSTVAGLNLSISLLGSMSMTWAFAININASFALNVNKGWSATFDSVSSLRNSVAHDDDYGVWTLNAGDTTHTLGAYTLTTGATTINAGALDIIATAPMTIDAPTIAIDSGTFNVVSSNVNLG